jgi:hypothetical protein
MNTAAIVNERKLTYYMIAKFTTDTPISISNKEAEAFIKLAIKDLGEGSEVELFQMGELWHD